MEDVEGLWTVEFSTTLGRGGGVAYFHNGRVHGGDGLYYYIGEYAPSPSGLVGNLRVEQFNSGVSVFGPLRSFDLSLSGAVRGDLIMAQGRLGGAMQQHISLKLSRVARA